MTACKESCAADQLHAQWRVTHVNLTHVPTMKGEAAGASIKNYRMASMTLRDCMLNGVLHVR
jgi:hypothetical protein